MSFQEYLEYTEKIANLVKEWEEVIQIAYTSNSDSIIAAGIFGRTFYDLARPCTIFPIKTNLIETFKERGDYPAIILGSSIDDLNTINLDYPILAIVNDSNSISNPKLNSKRITIMNPIDFGYAGFESSLSASAYFICSQISENLDYIVNLPLIGAQTTNMMGDYIGLHDFISQDALSGKIISVKKDLAFLGSDILNISDAILYSQCPFLPGLSGNERIVTEILTKSSIETETKRSQRKLSDLDKEEITSLNSNLILHLSRQKGHQEEELVFIKTKTKLLNEPKNSIVSNTWDFAMSINDALNRDRTQLALAVILGNRSDKLQQLNKMFIEERKAVSISFQFLMDHREDVIELSTLRYFLADRKISWFNATITAAMGLSNGLVSPDLPFAVVAPGPEVLFTIGVRASKLHKIEKEIKEIIRDILMERKWEVPVTGTRLSAQFSVLEDRVEPILLDLNAKLKEWLI